MARQILDHHGVVTDDLFKVEVHGTDHIPAHDRHGHPRDLAFLWAGAFVNYVSLFTVSLPSSR
jgi:hypothetical protein